MDNYIFKNFGQVRQWIEDNKLLRYNFSNTKASTTESRENSYVFCYNKDISPEENLRLLERRLDAHAGMRLYGKGWRTEGGNVGGYICEVEYGYAPDYMQRFEQMMNSPRGVGMQPAVDAEKLERDITEKLTMQFKLNQLESERKDFEREKKEFEQEKSGTIGAILSYLAPVAQAWMQKQGLAKMAGTDVPAEKIVPVADGQPENVETPDPNDLPDEEAARGYALLVRFRQVEPDYLDLLESVVTMAENGDSMYNMAKASLLKK